jgi:hypothetical protein
MGSLFIARIDASAFMVPAHNLVNRGLALLNNPFDLLDGIRFALRAVFKNISPGYNQAYYRSEYVADCFMHVDINFNRQFGNFITPGDIASDPRVHGIYRIIQATSHPGRRGAYLQHHQRRFRPLNAGIKKSRQY